MMTSPTLELVPVALIVAIALFTATLVRRQQAAVRDLDPLVLRDLVEWRRTVVAGLGEHEQKLRWIPREQVDSWSGAQPTVRDAQRVSRKRLSEEEVAALDLAASGLADAVAAANRRIVDESLIRFAEFFERIETKPLTREQAEAVLTFDNRVLVIAAAGSGKTSVMVARAAYAIYRGWVSPERILLLAFNRDAATELQQRLTSRLAALGLPAEGLQASTFHKFGLDVIGRATGAKPRPASWLAGGQDVAMVARILDELRDSSVEFRFRCDLFRLVFARASETPDGGEADSYDRDTKHTGFRTFNGETVKSQGERMVADWLFLNGVTYEYEKPYVHDTADSRHSQYRPDFYYPDAELWHEHWALDENGHPPASFEGYAADMQWKRGLHQRHGTPLIETTWAQILDQTGFEPFAAELRRHGITLNWNPDRPTPAAQPMKHEELAQLIRTFMAHVKSNGFTRDDLERRRTRIGSSYRTKLFLDLYWDVHDAWNARLQADGSVDFDDMLTQAADHLERGVDMGHDLILVDEFQDASRARARMVKGLVSPPDRYLMAVGDDWQAINRFAGADLSVMTQFSSWYGDGPQLRLETTFRTTQTIADTAGAFVAKNPAQLKKAVRAAKTEPGPPATLVRIDTEENIPQAIDAWLSALSRRVPGRASVDVLGRYGFERDLLPRRSYPNLTVTFRTAHGSKGLEADYVLIPRMIRARLGFPSAITDDPVLRLVVDGDEFPHAEERRLFYVALTRARREATLITVVGKESPFVAELVSDGRLALSELGRGVPAVVCPSCGTGVLVRRSGPYGDFMGCSRFPACRYSASRPDHAAT